MLVLAFTALALQVVAQSWSAAGHPSTPVVSAADSVRIVRSVRSAQNAFESFRRLRLPIGRGGTGSCDVRIGRYCYWRGDEDEEKPPPPEAPEIRDRRNALIRELDSASRTIVGDAWIAGQHVRYLVEADRIDDAWTFANRACGATASWCAALAGYAAHSGGRFVDAESAYTVALAAMEPAERCRWLDASNMFDDDLAHRFDKLDCAGREEFVRRVFWYGAPLYSVSSTDLLTEHLARVTRARIAEHSTGVDGEAWASDQRELMTRYGWPRWYSQSMPEYGSQRKPGITGHDAGMPYNYLPTLRALEHVSETNADDWHLDDPRALMGYSPAYARSMHSLPSQVARFRRGDSALVVAAWDARRDTTLLGRPLEAALVVARPGEPGAIVRQRSATVRGHIAVSAIVDSGVVSLELVAKDDRRAARARIGIAARTPGRVALSDLLLYSSTEAPPMELDAVRDSALASTVVPASRALGVFWESYGLRPTGEPVHFTLTVEEIEVSLLRRAAEKLRFSDPTSALRIQWDEVPQQRNGIAGRGVRVDLSRLRNGRYRMQLAIETMDGATATATRDVDVR